MFENSSVVVMDILGNLVTFIAPLWIAVIFGVVVGWAWKPKWAIQPNNYSWSTNLFKFRIPWFNDSELPNQPVFEHSTTRLAFISLALTLLIKDVFGVWYVLVVVSDTNTTPAICGFNIICNRF